MPHQISIGSKSERYSWSSFLSQILACGTMPQCICSIGKATLLFRGLLEVDTSIFNKIYFRLRCRSAYRLTRSPSTVLIAMKSRKVFYSVIFTTKEPLKGFIVFQQATTARRGVQSYCRGGDGAAIKGHSTIET